MRPSKTGGKKTKDYDPTTALQTTPQNCTHLPCPQYVIMPTNFGCSKSYGTSTVLSKI